MNKVPQTVQSAEAFSTRNLSGDERLQSETLWFLELFSDQASADWTVCGTFQSYTN
jgi:hypothetical protein